MCIIIIMKTIQYNNIRYQMCVPSVILQKYERFDHTRFIKHSVFSVHNIIVDD